MSQNSRAQSPSSRRRSRSSKSKLQLNKRPPHNSRSRLKRSPPRCGKSATKLRSVNRHHSLPRPISNTHLFRSFIWRRRSFQARRSRRRALRELGKYKLIYAAFGGSNTKSKVTERQSLRRRSCGCRHDRWP